MKVIACGSRTWTDAATILARLDQFPPGTIIVHGRSSGGGADDLIDLMARRLGFTVIPMPVEDEDRRRAGRNQRRAPIFRNMRMFREHPDATLVIAFWDGASPGTRHMRDEARRRRVEIDVVRQDGEQLSL